MTTENDVMDQVKRYAKEFVERRYLDEVPYFDIAWEIFEEALRARKDEGRGVTVQELKGPTVRDSGPRRAGDNIIMAPKVIRAFHILFTAAQTAESENNENLKQEMLQILLQKKFPLEFSTEIVDFFMENKDTQRI